MSLPRLVSVDYHSLMKRTNTLAAQIIPPPSSPPARPTAGDILQFLKEYESLGFTNGHRTGYSAHNDSAKWLANAVADATRSPQHLPVFEWFELGRIDTVEAYVEITAKDGTLRRIKGEKLLDSVDTSPYDDDEVVVVALTPISIYHPDYKKLMLAAPRKNIVILTKGLLNADMFTTPYPNPAIQVLTDHEEIRAASRIRSVVKSVVVNTATSDNIVLTLPAATLSSLPPVVVMTPRSSWFRSTAERGGGLVCWLHCIKAVAFHAIHGNKRLKRDVIFTANSGHELGHLGLHDFCERRPAIEKTATWIHFGANIGAAKEHGQSLIVLSNDDDLRALVDGSALKPDRMDDKTSVPRGETKEIHLAGGKYLTVMGTLDLFHQPDDVLSNNCCDFDEIARIADVMCNDVVLKLLF